MNYPKMKIKLCDKENLNNIIDSNEPIDFRNVNFKALQTISINYKLDTIRLYHITCKDINCIAAMSNLRRLEINWVNKVSDFSSISKLTNLKQLSIEDAPLLKDISFLEKMKVTSLKLSGGEVGKPLRLTTINLISKMMMLEELELLNLKIDDDDITCIANVPNLKSLTIANMFNVDQFAFLAAKLNSKLIEPISPFSESSMECDKCKSSKVMVTGKRMPFLCPKCDNSKIDQFVNKFKIMVKNIK